MQVFTIDDGTVTAGAQVEKLPIKGANIEIPAIIVGEEGRGRSRGVLPVDNPPMVNCRRQNDDYSSRSDKCSDCGTTLSDESERGYRHHPDSGTVPGRLMFATVGKTRAEKPKLFACTAKDDNENIIIVFRTPIGYRGGNDHTGDRNGLYKVGDDYPKLKGVSRQEAETYCDENEISHDEIYVDGYLPFPGQVIAEGNIAQGTAGGMGSGSQLVAIMSKGVVFRTAYSGRRYGAPRAHYYLWNGENLLSVTWDERASSDIF